MMRNMTKLVQQLKRFTIHAVRAPNRDHSKINRD